MKTLQHYKNLTISAQIYDPELSGTVIFHVDEEGRDWYELQKTFSEDTIKVGYNAQGVVCTVSEHVYAIAPTGLSIVEVESLPENFVLEYGAYEYLNGEVVPRIPTDAEIAAAADERRKQLMSAISVELDTLEDIAVSGTGTEQELNRLAALKQYRIALMRLDITQPWPELPDVA
ncbi:tail assembly chaperone [Yersinia enterocolitica]|uniref:tail fiber assembly protein n=1 Tax=Yersinia enterocolitica TaxID=630 RepID=UPI0005E3A93A|nr:tail assembly chaperone [Yersinia enterocolitica]EKN4828927.1 tail assembly chaperone [Yersinia enterocolitica]ELW8174854.1 tail assembly chaperone [Yersinia enterocolitica]UYJ78302.1 tail assembly chaperone [Yersinia enterocolitica]CNE88414.1 bacteriophage protein [Yersinia enterocolitica]CQH58295.1 bacteriophage protein [Yersinia enterocolitica]